MLSPEERALIEEEVAQSAFRAFHASDSSMKRGFVGNRGAWIRIRSSSARHAAATARLKLSDQRFSNRCHLRHNGLRARVVAKLCHPGRADGDA